MKKFFIYFAAIALSLFPVSKLFAQQKGNFNKKKQDERKLINALAYLEQTAEVVDINRIPINICFINHGERYVGFIIAGHATKQVCQVASLQIKNFLDSVGYNEHTIFSYGVGFDLCGSRDTAVYNKKLKYLEQEFENLEVQYSFEVHVRHVSDSAFFALSQHIKDNAALANQTLAHKDSAQRIIFRYANERFPIPVPFYTRNGMVKFSISKSELGDIPGFNFYDPQLIDRALNEIRTEIALDKKALDKINSLPITINTGTGNATINVPCIFKGKADAIKFVQMDLGKIVTTYIQSSTGSSSYSYYSYAEIQQKCAAGESLQIKYNNGYITPCEAVNIIKAGIAAAKTAKALDLQDLKDAIDLMQIELTRIAAIKATYSHIKPSRDNALLIDAFLRGWCFRTDDPAMDKQLATWYQKRPAVWETILSQDKDFRKRLQTSSDKSAPNTVIAGIFQYDDVFFAVKDAGSNYEITPYKMVCSNFVQVVNKESQVSQLLSENNFRLVKL